MNVWHPDTCDCCLEMNKTAEACLAIIRSCDTHTATRGNDSPQQRYMHIKGVNNGRNNVHSVVANAVGDYNWHMNGDKIQVEVNLLQVASVTLALTTAGLLSLVDVLGI